MRFYERFDASEVGQIGRDDRQKSDLEKLPFPVVRRSAVLLEDQHSGRVVLLRAGSVIRPASWRVFGSPRFASVRAWLPVRAFCGRSPGRAGVRSGSRPSSCLWAFSACFRPSGCAGGRAVVRSFHAGGFLVASPGRFGVGSWFGLCLSAGRGVPGLLRAFCGVSA